MTKRSSVFEVNRVHPLPPATIILAAPMKCQFRINGQCCPCAPYTRVCVAAETADEGLRGGDTSTSGRGTVPESGTADARRP